MDKMIFQIPGVLVGFSSKINSYKWSYESDRLQVTGEHIARFHDLHQQPSWMTISKHEIQPNEILSLPVPEVGVKKSPSKRLRDTIYVLWSQTEDKREFDDYYNGVMEKFINMVKEKLD